VAGNISSVEAGHQCYKVAEIPRTVRSGTNATIQLEYWSHDEAELGGRNQSFYACADIVSTFLSLVSYSRHGPSPKE
jgi:hypothetical protein